MSSNSDKNQREQFETTVPVDHRGTGNVLPEHVGPYKILEVLGEGGMGVVYLAEQTEPIRRRVALKLIKLGMDSVQVIARFESERQALALMNHPNVAKVFDAGTTERGRPYFVMEHVPGVPITRYCDENRLTTEERLSLFTQVCHAVQHAHQKGIIHRDLKPSNVLVAVEDGNPVPKVIDFGIAKAVEQKLTDKTLFTELGQIVGTPAYMSPEQADLSALDIDTRTDIYSLGVMLYQLLSGSLPFEPTTLRRAAMAEIQRIIREEDPPKPSTRMSGQSDESGTIAQKRRTTRNALERKLRGDLDWIVMKCLEKDRTRRYETANGLALDIRRHLSSEPVLASPPSTSYRLRKFIRRNKGPVTGVASVVITLTAGLAMTVHLYVAAEKARAETALQRDHARREAETAKQVQAFLIDLFRVSDPSEARGNTITAREIMDRGAERIERELVGQPLIQATLLQTISEVYRVLGLYDKAKPLAQLSLSVRRDARGNDHADIADSLMTLAGVLYNQGKYADTEKLFREGLAMRRKLLGDEHPDVVVSLNNLATILGDQGKYAEAERIHRQALNAGRKVFGNDHQTVADSLSGLANVVGSQGRYAESEGLHREALGMYRGLLGNEHIDVARSLSNLAVAIVVQGKYAEAEGLHREALAVRRKLLGNEHREVADSQHNLAAVLSNLEKYAEAEEFAREALGKFRRVLGDEHAVVAISRAVLLNILRAEGKIEESRPLVVELLTSCRNRAERDDASADDFNALAWHLLTIEPVDLRDPSTALAAAQKAVEKTGAKDPAYLDTLALAQKMTGDVDAAVETQKVAIVLLPRRPSPIRTEFETNLAKYLLEQLSYAEAEPLLLRLHQELNAHPDTSGTQKRESVGRIIQLYEAWHKAEPDRGCAAKAAEWRANLFVEESSPPGKTTP